MTISAAGFGKASSSASIFGSTWPCGQMSGSDPNSSYSACAAARTTGIGLK
jgi:hypothetical protein